MVAQLPIAVVAWPVVQTSAGLILALVSEPLTLVASSVSAPTAVDRPVTCGHLEAYAKYEMRYIVKVRSSSWSHCKCLAEKLSYKGEKKFRFL